ncbi:MAG: phosphoribosyltransferase, partial [Mesorhizobium sp.]
LSVAGKTVIVVDDGAATGTTMKVAIRALKRRSPRKIIVALPVAPPETVDELAQEADLTICLNQPARFRALSYYYGTFPQLSDSEVLDMVALARDDRRNAVERARSGANAASKSRHEAGT